MSEQLVAFNLQIRIRRVLKTLRGTLFVIACISSLLVTAGFAQDEGTALFNAKCSMCHGTDGSGKTAAAKKLDIPDLRSKEVQVLSDNALFETIAHGAGHKEAPHAFVSRGTMTAKEVRLLIKHVRYLAATSKSRAAAHGGGKAKAH